LLDAQPQEDEEDGHPGEHRPVRLAIRGEPPPDGGRDEPQRPGQELDESGHEKEGRVVSEMVEVPDQALPDADGLAALEVRRRQQVGHGPRQRGQRDQTQSSHRSERRQLPDAASDSDGRHGGRDDHEARQSLCPERSGHAEVEAHQGRTPRRERL
jgi:hypothetical protein